MNADIIIVGGGTSWCVIAGRLKQAKPDLKIVLVEPGPDIKNDDSVKMPLVGKYSALMGKNATTYISRSDAALNDREIAVACGEAIGGGSAVNFMIYNQAAASDWDDWKQPGWSYEEMKEYIDKPIVDGPMQVTHGGHTAPEWMTDFYRAVAETRDMPLLADMADRVHGDGYGRHAKWITSNGERSSAAAYLEGLDIIVVHGRVSHILFNEDQAIGVAHEHGEIHADRIVLSAGTLGSSPILERSGIGKREVLERAGVPIKVELDVGVVKDHQKLLVPYIVDDSLETLDAFLNLESATVQKEIAQWQADGTGQVATNGIHYGLKWHPTDAEIKGLGEEFEAYWRPVGHGKPDKALCTVALACQFIGDRRGLPPGTKYMTFGMWTNYPESSGSIHITAGGLEFKAGLLHSASDMAVLVHAYKCDTIGLPTTDDDIVEYIKNNINTCWHPMGTCVMKAREQGGVVDPSLNVYGVKGLKVADMSVAFNMGTNTTSTALAIGEKCAAMILENLQ